MQSNRIVRYSVTYDVVTPESAAEGEFAETGFAAKDRILQWGDTETVAEAAADVVAERLGHCEASSSGPLDAHDWFTQSDADVDYRAGTATRESVHFEGLTDAETRDVADLLIARGLLSPMYARRA